MIAFEDLTAAAYKGERVAGRRLAARLRLSEAQALLDVMTQAAGAQGLPALLAARAQSRALDAERLLAKAQKKAMDRAAQLARRPDASTPSGGAPAGAQAWRAWFDGSAHPNPGRIGIGALLLGPDGQRVEISRHAGHGNSGDAEYLALTALLEAAVQLRINELQVFGDSQVVVNDVQPAGGPGAKGLEAHRARVMELLASLGQVSVCWVPRHRNGAADRLSQLAASAPPDNMQAAPRWRQP